MKRIIAVSDSHGMQENLQEAVKLAMDKGKIDIMVFLGDGMSDFENVKPMLLARNPDMQFVAVRGNNDFSSQAPMLEEFSVYGRKLLAAHGHLYHVKFGLNRLLYTALERSAAAALYGHTHNSRLEEAQGVWLINPGAICSPSSRSSAFAEILVEKDGTIRPNLIRWSGAPF